jgi:anti-sigma factor RsiW
MSDQDSARLRAQMSLDGELDAANQLAFERELRASPELTAEYERQRALRRAIRRHASREAAPEGLRARMEALAAPAPSPAVQRPRWAMAATAASIAFVAALGGYWAGHAGGDPGLAALVAGYQRAALSGQPIDVASSDRHTVKPWLAGRAPLGAFVPDLAHAGFPLLGGRIDIVDGRPAPTLVYKRGAHLISVSELPLGQAAQGATTLDGYHVERWSDAERAYVAISDIDPSELAEFVAAFRRAKES